ncbi:4672_t:CDS:1, partial [Cetraspora pellucida]
NTNGMRDAVETEGVVKRSLLEVEGLVEQNVAGMRSLVIESVVRVRSLVGVKNLDGANVEDTLLDWN